MKPFTKTTIPSSDQCRTQYPIILVHGAGYRDFKHPNYWGRIPHTLAKQGASIFHGEQDAWGTIAENARFLKKRVLAVSYYCAAAEAESLVKQIAAEGGTAQAYQVNIADPAAVLAMVQAVESELGPIDCLVNNAGIAQQKLMTDITTEDWIRMVATNLSGTFYCCQAVLPGMIRRKAGAIVNLSSIWGLTGASCEVHYSAVKAGILGLTKALAKEVGPSGIRVNCVAPGVIETEMNAALSDETRAALAGDTPLQRLGTPEEVAECIYFLASDKASFLTGQVLSPNGGFVI